MLGDSMKNKRILLCDLDGTLINEKYALTVASDEVVRVIREKQAEGWLIGLNSDTPFEPLRNWAARLQMNGPIICEMGQVLANSPGDRPEFYGTMAAFFQDLRQKVALRAQESIKHAFVGIGDVTEFMANEGKIFGVDKYAILINGYRQCSFSGYAKACRNGALVNDPEIFNRFSEIVLAAVGDELQRLDPADRSGRYAILILHEKGVSKSLAVKRFIDRFGDESEYIIIGDGKSDMFDEKASNVRVCAVGNADPALKENARQSGGIVAKGLYTEGVLEILLSI
jgi:hydroxymethylpyrimidine pyrophosphatase-like HAD family hydrolase